MAQLGIILSILAVMLSLLAVIMHGWEIAQSNSTVILFYAPWCGYCKEIIPIWDELEGELDNVDMKKVNGDEQTELTKKYGVTKYPTIIKITGQKNKEFQKERTKKNISKFIQYS